MTPEEKIRGSSRLEDRIARAMEDLGECSAVEIAHKVYPDAENIRAKTSSVSVTLKRMEKKDIVELSKKVGKRAFFVIKSSEKKVVHESDEKTDIAYLRGLEQYIVEELKTSKMTSASSLARSRYMGDGNFRKETSKMAVYLQRMEKKGLLRRSGRIGKKVFYTLREAEGEWEPPTLSVPQRIEDPIPEIPQPSYPQLQKSRSIPKMPKLPRFVVPGSLVMLSVLVVYFVFATPTGFVVYQEIQGDYFQFSLSGEESAFNYTVKNIHATSVSNTTAELKLPLGTDVIDPGLASIEETADAVFLRWDVGDMRTDESRVVSFSADVVGSVGMNATGSLEKIRNESITPGSAISVKKEILEFNRLSLTPASYISDFSITLTASGQKGTVMSVYLDPDGIENGNEDLVGEVNFDKDWTGTLSFNPPVGKYTEQPYLALYANKKADITVDKIDAVWTGSEIVGDSGSVEISETTTTSVSTTSTAVETTTTTVETTTTIETTTTTVGNATTTTVPSTTTTISNTTTTTLTNVTQEYVQDNDIEEDVEEQGRAEIGKDVKWTKRIKLSRRSTKINVTLPVGVTELNVSKIVDGMNIEVVSDNVTTYSKNQTSDTLVIEGEADEIELNYTTPSPNVTEEIFEDYRKQVIISSDIHYENISAYTTIYPEAEEKFIKLYHLNDTDRILVSDVNYTDTNANGLVDRIDWVVSHLSNQTYEIIVITDAQHLDSNREFISNIYDEVSELDGNWSEVISVGDYVRVTFERNLTSENDITVYPRIVNGNPRIEIYEINGTELIAEFTSLTENEYNKVFLTGLSGIQDTFDLKILGGRVEFDHIVDPVTFTGGDSAASLTLTGDTSTLAFTTGTGNTNAVLIVGIGGDLNGGATSGVDAVYRGTGTLCDTNRETFVVNETVTNGDAYNEIWYLASFTQDASARDICVDWGTSDSPSEWAYGVVMFEGVDTSDPIAASGTTTGTGTAVTGTINVATDEIGFQQSTIVDNGVMTIEPTGDAALWEVTSGGQEKQTIYATYDATVASPSTLGGTSSKSEAWSMALISLKIVPPVDSTVPLWNSSSTYWNANTTTPDINEGVLLYSMGLDETALDWAILETNETGSYDNKTVYSSPSDMSDAVNTWTWSNFSWYNSSVNGSTKIGWRVYYNDTTNNQNLTDTLYFTVQPSTTISFTSGTVDFGDLAGGASNNTTDGNPAPFTVRNDGNVFLNLSISGTSLWSTDAVPTSNYQAMCGSTGEWTCSSGSVNSFTNIPSSSSVFVYNLPWESGSDEVELEVNVTVPSDETGGVKNSTITITSSAS